MDIFFRNKELYHWERNLIKDNFEVVYQKETWHRVKELKGLSATGKFMLSSFLKGKLFSRNLREGMTNRGNFKVESV